MRYRTNEAIIQVDDNGFDVELIHAPNALGDDRTLCGMALEGMGRKEDTGSDWHSFAVKTGKKVDCPKCLAIIRFCVNLSKIESKR